MKSKKEQDLEATLSRLRMAESESSPMTLSDRLTQLENLANSIIEEVNRARRML